MKTIAWRGKKGMPRGEERKQGMGHQVVQILMVILMAGDKRSKGQKRRSQREKVGGKKNNESDKNDMPEHNNGSLRKQMGLEWMLKPGNIMHDKPTSEGSDQESQGEQVKKINKKELNPYLQDNGSGYPDDDPDVPNSSQLLSSSLVGDGGASWRLKALKRAKEQAAHEGRTLQDVVGERWGSLQDLAASVAINRAAPGHAHLSAINKRKKGKEDITENQNKRSEGPDDLQDVYSQHTGMKKPKRDIFQWRSSRSQTISSKDSSLISEALSGINKFTNDGSFMDIITNQQSKDVGVHDHSSTGIKEAKNLQENYLVSDSNDFGNHFLV
ncbi:hypothetical protein HPP92_017789 [Vanilla planifolia]|uniref:Uncharacterized protein n=1 Tax=Vanilla planifolia TaxID=51239 RepID=A0A835UQW7_VANPL|nr:hypothetical protein HPP92_017789 [Vanilla planifolia]